MAAPHTAGVAALLLSVNPSLTSSMIKNIIMTNADPITISTPDGNQNVLRLNAAEAMTGNMQVKRNMLIKNTSLTLDRLIIIDGAILTLRNVNVSNLNDQAFGFEIRNGGRLVLENGSILYLGGGRLIASGFNSRIEVNSSSAISIFSGGNLQLLNGASATFNRSDSHINGGRVTLSGGSRLEFTNDSNWWTSNNADIVGNSANDEVIVDRSNFLFSAGTRFSRGGNTNWRGLTIRDCIFPTTVRLRGTFSGMNNIDIFDSRVLIDNATFDGIGQLRVTCVDIQNITTRLNITNTIYRNNQQGIRIVRSLFNINGLNINGTINGTDLEILHATGNNSIYDLSISSSNNFGIEINSSYINANKLRISNILGNGGFYAFRAPSSIIRGDSSIRSGGVAVVRSDVQSSFPWFAPDVNKAIPTITSPNQATFYFRIDTFFTGGRNVGCVTVNQNNLAKFSPSRNHYIICSGCLGCRSDSLFKIAMTAIVEDNHAEAFELMKEIVESYPETEDAVSALAFLPFINNWLGGDIHKMIVYFEGITHENLQCVKQESIAMMVMNTNDYYHAFYLYEEIIITAKERTKQLLAELSQAYCYYRLSSGGYEKLPSEARRTPHTFDEFNAIFDEIMAEIRGESMKYIIEDCEEEEVEELLLSSNVFPNPFNPETTINFVLPSDGDISLTIYNIRGQRVKTLINNYMVRGQHSVVWDSRNDQGRTLGSGIYFYILETNSGREVRRMLLMK